MARIAYRTYTPKPETITIIERANEILDEYAEQGFNLTLRQLYYQFISRDLFPDSYIDPTEGTKNNISSYNKLKAIVSAAREGGMIDWDRLVDRGRSSEARPHWTNASHFIRTVTPQFSTDLWRDQPKRVEVWVEKDALSDVVERACRPLDVPYTACKGYMSASTMWDAAHNRMLHNWNEYEQETVVLHLGDHDPSGIDMTRDIEERLTMFAGQADGGYGTTPAQITVARIALTRAQVRRYTPPPNPAKETDTRFRDYETIHGAQSWELDALSPQIIMDLITRHIRAHMDRDLFRDAIRHELSHRNHLRKVHSNWEEIEELIDTKPDAEGADDLDDVDDIIGFNNDDEEDDDDTD